MSTLFRWSCLLLVGALVVAGPAAHAQDEKELMLSLDQEFARLAEGVPGFGGLYLDEKGTTHVYLVDLSRAREVQDLGARVEVHQGQYDFRDLFAWKAEVRGLLGRRGTLSLDIDERRNRLVFEVERGALEAFRAELPALLRSTRVPIEAVVVEAAEPMVPHEMLTDRFRPIPGGVEIRNSNGGICTLGVNAIRFGVRGFVTNSHCTATRSVVEGTVFSQNVVSLGNLVGSEIADPPFLTNATDSDCPSGRQCRYSDAAFVDYVAEEAQSAGGKIANGFICGVAGAPGVLQVNPAVPRIPVTSVMLSTPISGMVLTKVGRTTGCTLGAQQSTCIDSNVSAPHPFIPNATIDTGITMLCQNRVSALSQGGDSGSPVFLNQGGGAIVAGLLWGGNGSSFVYSPWLFLFTELNGVVPEVD